MDNLAVHKCQNVIDQLKILGIQAIFNIPYKPEYNPIETYFAHVKNKYRQIKLEIMIED